MGANCSRRRLNPVLIYFAPPCVQLTAADRWVILVTRLCGRAVVIANWTVLLLSQYRLRRLQRIWGNLGQFLQLYPGSLRRRLQRILPITR